MKQLLVISLFLCSVSAFATHERAGEITFKCLGGLRYEITVTTYTKGSSNPADRCFLSVYFGDGDTAVVCRSNFEPGDPTVDPWGASSCAGPGSDCATHHMGQWTTGCGMNLQQLDVKKNVYTTIHTYPGPGTYVISMTDPNRNSDIVNIPSQTAFSIQDTMVINPFFGCNNSPELTNCPIDKACAGLCFVHNPGATDPDGDSLSYHLGKCFEAAGAPIPGYSIPAGVSVNPATGDFTWCNPPPPAVTGSAGAGQCDEYNFAIDIQEWRKIGNKRYLIATVRRDMQVTVCSCKNQSPVIDAVNDTCVLANTNLTFTVTATDPGGNTIQAFTATGGPFSASPAATFVSDVPPKNTIATGVFSWTPSCNQVRKAPYLTTLKATDDGAPDNPPVILSDYQAFFITVIAPAPQNLLVGPKCTNIDLTWNAALCNPATNNLKGYKIYRKTLPAGLSCDTLQHGACETGMPASWGYTLIATVGPGQLTYSDNSGLSPGLVYSYRVLAYYNDGAESYISDPACKKLVRDVPIITNVDVISTGTSGSINVKWVKPIADTNNFDTTIAGNQGPYQFDVLRAPGYGNPVPPAIASFSSPYYGMLNTTSYLDSPLGTVSSSYSYRIGFNSSPGNSCPAEKASSVFLTCNPNDNQIKITWAEQVPWTNYRYDVFKLNYTTTNWDSIGTTTLRSFTDTALTNGATYCYKVKSIGEYPDTTLPRPLINWSQELCCSPIDQTPPCPLTLAVDSSCEEEQNLLSWNNPNNFCSDDALYYIIYHKPVEDGDFSLLDTVPLITTTTYLHNKLTSIAGCYVVTSVDSFGNQSAYSNVVCVDNCPFYALPNVFTPNGNNLNDLFTPLHPYKYVKDIDIRIFNRWGTEVFHTTDPEILWNGKSAQTNMLCADGVYYYVCIVNDIRLKGIVPRTLKGYVHLLSH